MLCIISNGNVGIGSSLPAVKLDVLGNIRSTGTLNVGVGSTMLCIIDNGNVGIGSTIPAVKLDILGNIRSTGTLNVGVGSTMLCIIDNGNVGIGSSLPAVKLDILGNMRASGTLNVGVGSTMLCIIQNGNVGMGSSLPAVKLDILGNMRASGTLNVGIGSTMLCIITNGNVGIGSTLPAAKLDVLGNIRATDALFTGTLNVGTGGSSTTVTGPFMKQGGWTPAGSTHTISNFYVADNSAGNIQITVKSEATESKIGTANVSFVKTLGSAVDLLIISQHTNANLSTFTIAASGNNITVGTDTNCKVYWTSTGAF